MNIPYKKDIKVCFSAAIFFILILTVIVLSCCRVEAASPFIETEGLSITQFIDMSTENYVLLEKQETAHQMADCARKLGHSEDSEVIVSAKQIWIDCENEIAKNLAEEKKWITRYEEYPYATYIWLFFTKGLGYSDEVAAGILGNIMAEVGGGTLNIQYWLYGSGQYYYGMCQWAKTYFPEVRGMDLIGQCEYLAQTIESQINAFGKAYNKDNAFSEFLKSTSCRSAAKMFAQLYEACDSNTYSIRQSYAEKAYEYFTRG